MANSAAYEDISERVKDINVPTLILAGDQDRQDPLHQQQTEVLPRIPGARLEVCDSGHLSPIDQPGRLADAIRAFLYHWQLSPRERSEFCVRERTVRAVRADQREAHRLEGAFLDSFGTRIVVEVRLGEAGGGGVDLDPG